MTRRNGSLVLGALLYVFLGAGAGEARAQSPGSGSIGVEDAGDLPPHEIAQPDAPVVTPRNLLASERFWPYRVGLVKSWLPPGRSQELRVGTTGVLIRVEPEGRALVDFGRDGRFEVPIAKTDLLEGANRLRRGETSKAAPNYVLAIGPRLIDSAADPPRGLPFRDVLGFDAFLSVFVDGEEEALAAVAASLDRFVGRPGLLTVVFPQGRRPDSELWERLRELGWRVPYVYAHLAEPYTATLLPAGLLPPAILLQSDEGRLLLAESFTPDVAGRIEAALDEHFPVAPPRAAESISIRPGTPTPSR